MTGRCLEEVGRGSYQRNRVGDKQEWTETSQSSCASFSAMCLLALLFIGLANGEENAGDCQPMLADYCFQNFSLSATLCYNSRNCDFNPDTVCNTIEDRIDCAQEVIDGDCQTKGRNNFDRWINAILAVHTFVCKYENNKEYMVELIKEEKYGKKCWDMDVFLQCVKEKTRVTHIVDMLQVIIDINECNWILIALATCNAKAETCTGRKDFLTEVFHIFIEQSKCTAYCSSCPKNSHYEIIKLMFALLLIQYIYIF